MSAFLSKIDALHIKIFIQILKKPRTPSGTVTSGEVPRGDPYYNKEIFCTK